jgi:hypothetical protein
MQYLPLFLLFLAVLIGAWFYLQRAKGRDVGSTTVERADPPAERPTASVAAPSDRPE